MAFYNSTDSTVRFSTRNRGVPNVSITIYYLSTQNDQKSFTVPGTYIPYMGNTTITLGKDVSKTVRLVRKISNYKNFIIIKVYQIKICF